MAADNIAQIQFNDFSAGWCPSDNAVNGRKNALLKMDGVTLDDNGALVLAQGMVQEQGPYVSNAHSLYQKLMCGERRSYVGLEDGSVWRNSTKLIDVGAGSVDRAAFGIYGDYVLIISGDKRLKDSCTNTIDLGLTPPNTAPLINLFNTTTITWQGTLANWVQTHGTVAVVGNELEFTTTDVFTNFRVASAADTKAVDYPPLDLSGKEEDVFQFSMSADDPTKIKYVFLRFFLSATPGVSAFTDAYHFQFDNGNLAPLFSGDNFGTLGAKRSDFTREGSDGSLDWHNVAGVEIIIGSDVFDSEADCFIKDFKLATQTEPTDADTAGNLNGTYEWVQVNVISNGSYVAMSKPGPITDQYTLINGYAEVIPEDPTLIEPNANEVWIFRRGGTLDQFYRVGRILYTELGPLYDNMSDEDALTLGIILNPNLLSVNADDLPDDILEIVGPIFGRMVYFSSTKVYFTEVGNPDAYDPRNVMLLVSDDAEKFQWARKVSENTIMIGTLHDVYLLTGTFTQFPDGALDVYLRSLGVNKPPMSRFVSIHNGNAIYFGSQEWIAMSPSGQYQTLTSPNTDILYTGQTKYGYGGVPTYINTPDVSYACAVAKNKLWVVVPVIVDYTDPGNIALWEYRMEVFDFARKYWRPLPYSAFLLVAADDEALYGFFNATKTVNYMDSPFTKLLNAT